MHTLINYYHNMPRILVSSIPIEMYTTWSTCYYGDIFPYLHRVIAHHLRTHNIILITMNMSGCILWWIHYQTCELVYHLLSRQLIIPVPMVLMQYLPLTTHEVLPNMLDNIILLPIFCLPAIAEFMRLPWAIDFQCTISLHATIILVSFYSQPPE